MSPASRQTLVETLTRELLPAAGAGGMSHGVFVLQLAPAELVPTASRLKREFGFDMLLDVTAVDWLTRQPRFEVVHHLYASTVGQRVRLKTSVSEDAAQVDSLTALYASAAYMERECHEMFGIGFAGNHDLRPILLYEGFVGHPLRKDYAKTHEQPLVPYRN
jgi:NADH-quinone oxidoreductase subunit C